VSEFNPDNYPGQLPLVLTKNKSVTLFLVWRLKLLKSPCLRTYALG